jgi:hypothetical protein
LDQTGTHGILTNIAGFFFETFVMSQPVFEKIPLPLEPQSPRSPPFPISDTLGNIRFWRKSKNKMHMVRHYTGCMNPPNPELHPMPNRIPKAESCFGNRKRFHAPILGAASDKKYSRLNIDPQR